MGMSLDATIVFGFLYKDEEGGEEGVYETCDKLKNLLETSYEEEEVKPVSINGIDCTESELEDYWAALAGFSYNDNNTDKYYESIITCPFDRAIAGTEGYSLHYIVLKEFSISFDWGVGELDISKLNVPEDKIKEFKDFFKKEFDLDIDPNWYVLPSWS